MSLVYQGDDLRPAGAAGTRQIPDGQRPHASSDLVSGFMSEGRKSYGEILDARPRISFMEEEVMVEAAETVASKFCAMEPCRAFHKKDSLYCQAHSKQVFDRKRMA